MRFPTLCALSVKRTCTRTYLVLPRRLLPDRSNSTPAAAITSDNNTKGPSWPTPSAAASRPWPETRAMENENRDRHNPRTRSAARFLAGLLALSLHRDRRRRICGDRHTRLQSRARTARMQVHVEHAVRLVRHPHRSWAYGRPVRDARRALLLHTPSVDIPGLPIRAAAAVGFVPHLHLLDRRQLVDQGRRCTRGAGATVPPHPVQAVQDARKGDSGLAPLRRVVFADHDVVVQYQPDGGVSLGDAGPARRALPDIHDRTAR